MGVIGEAVVVLRPDLTGFGASAKAGITKELGAQDLFAGAGASSARARDSIGRDFTAAGATAGDAMDKATSRISGGFNKLGSELGTWGLPFSGALGSVGSKIDSAQTKGAKLGQTLSTIGGIALATGVVGIAAIAGESVHLASGLQASDAQIASHANISVNAANNIGKAWTNNAFSSIYSANQLSSALAPVSGEVAEVAGHALTTGDSLKFMAANADLAEASGGNLNSTTNTVAKTMQAFGIPLKNVTGLTNDLFNTSRITGVGVDALGSVIDRLKARLGIAAPTVGDLSALLVDLNEHGVQGSRGLLVVNTAINTLLQSVPKVDAATAKAADTFATKYTAASAAAAKSTDAVSAAQTKATAAVAAAQQNLAYVQDRIAASTTAGAPTTSQQIELAKANDAVTKAQASGTTAVAAAQDRASASQDKLTTLQTAAGKSTNAQVLAMQQLGLQVYNSSGSFVGMRSVIEQLQPRLVTMTQQQQLATLTQIFGASASKSLLDTVLAGPAAYDKANKAVTDSAGAHAAAEKQSKTLAHEADTLKAGLVDEGDKLGLYLIPKLQEFAHWTQEDIRWLQKHKDVAEALGIVLGGAVAIAVGAFAINMGTKVVRSVGDAGRSVGSFATTVGEKLGIVKTKVQDTTDTEQSSAVQFQTSADQISESISIASSNIIAALGNIGDSLDGLVTSISESAGKVDGSFATLSESASGSSGEVSTSLDAMVTSTTDSGLLIIANNEKIALSYTGIGTAAEGASVVAGGATEGLAAKSALGAGAAEATAAASAKTAGLSDLRAAEPGLLEAGGAAGGTGLLARLGAGAPASAGSALPAAIAGITAFQGTTALLKNNTLGLGTAVKSVTDNVLGLFGHDPRNSGVGQGSVKLGPASIQELENIALGLIQDAKISAATARADLHSSGVTDQQINRSRAGQLARPVATAGDLGSKIDVLNQLQRQAYLVAVADGGNSAQAKAALKSLHDTEAKWLPGLSKDESLKGVNAKIFEGTLALHQNQAKLDKLSSEGTLKDSTKKLEDLKSTFKLQQKAGASETTLKQTHDEMKATQTHIDALKGAQDRVAKDTTIIQKSDQAKAAMEKVNTNIDKLRELIRTNPPPTQKATGTLKLKASG